MIVPAMAEILVGTSNWADHERFYPAALEKGARQREKLTYYARFFPIVEVDTTFYGIPRLSTVEGWLQRTPPGFRFNVKAYRSLTGRDPLVTAITSVGYPTAAHRPTNSTLDCTRFAQVFGFRATPWPDEVEAVTRALIEGRIATHVA